LPLYDYDCAACGRRFEVIHGVHADPPASCPLCGSGPVKKAISAPTVHYKGSGWAKKERRAAVKSGASSGRGDDDSADRGSDRGPDKGASTDTSGSSSDAATSSTSPAAKDGESSTGPAKPSKSGAPSKAPIKTSD
jgi:putative FmdB family regulatory protein